MRFRLSRVHRIEYGNNENSGVALSALFSAFWKPNQTVPDLATIDNEPNARKALKITVSDNPLMMGCMTGNDVRKGTN